MPLRQKGLQIQLLPVFVKPQFSISVRYVTPLQKHYKFLHILLLKSYSSAKVKQLHAYQVFEWQVNAIVVEHLLSSIQTP